jgi:hypothetical protein
LLQGLSKKIEIDLLLTDLAFQLRIPTKADTCSD